MLRLKPVARNRVLAYSFLFRTDALSSVSSSTPSASAAGEHLPPASSLAPSITASTERDVVLAFKDWFGSGSNALLDRIYAILKSQNADNLAAARSADSELSKLDLRLSEDFVLKVLKYGTDVLSCLKFYDWAGRQPGFCHTRVTFHAIFKILSRAKLNGLMLDFLQTYKKRGYGHHGVQFKHTLVMGYALAGKPEVALHVLANMRFGGAYLDDFGYHVLLNSCVDAGRFDVVDALWNQIKEMGYENEVTYSIIMKSFCKQGHLDEAESYLRDLLGKGKNLTWCTMVHLVGAFCKRKEYNRVMKLIEEANDSGLIPMEKAYGAWTSELVRCGKLDEALKFFQSKKVKEGCLPDVSKYKNGILVKRLLRRNKLEEIYDLLMKMQECGTAPNKVTMDAALCFLCKAGMTDVARELYNMKEDLRLSPSGMAHRLLINNLCRDGDIDGAFEVFKRSLDHGYVPNKNTLCVLGNALCKEGNLDKMKELVIFDLEKRNSIPRSLYAKFVSLLCQSSRLEDGYLVHTSLEGTHEVTSRYTYANLIDGFSKTNRGDIAARLLIEMQDKGYKPTWTMYRTVIKCLCNMENPENHFFKFVEMQLSRPGADRFVYHHLLDGVGRAGRPDLAARVFEVMQRSQIRPKVGSYILLLQCYLKNKRFTDSLWLFTEERQKCLDKKVWLGKAMYNVMIDGLCQGGKVDIALDVFSELRGSGRIPSLRAYEELAKALCSNGRYDTVLHIINDLLKVRTHRLTSFLGNTLLLHAFQTRSLYSAWVRLGLMDNKSSPVTLRLCRLVGVVSGCIDVSDNIEELENMVEECFPFDVWTYNLLLRRLRYKRMSLAYELYKRMCHKGYAPDQWTYDIMIGGFVRHGMHDEVKYWVQDMLRKGFEPPDSTQFLLGTRGRSKFVTAARSYI